MIGRPRDLFATSWDHRGRLHHQSHSYQERRSHHDAGRAGIGPRRVMHRQGPSDARRPRRTKAIRKGVLPSIDQVQTRAEKQAIKAKQIMLYGMHTFRFWSFLMIISDRDKRTEHFATGEHAKEFSGFARQADIRRDRVDAATCLADLGALPGNRLQGLKGNRAGQFLIRINDQWRICFSWPEGSPSPVDGEIINCS